MYSSSLSTWRRQREAADLAALAPQKRGPKADLARIDAQHITQLTRERDHLRVELDKAQLVIAGANPLIMVAAHSGFAALWHTVLVGVLALAAVAFVWSRVLPGLARYPLAWFERSPSTVLWGVWGE